MRQAGHKPKSRNKSSDPTGTPIRSRNLNGLQSIGCAMTVSKRGVGMILHRRRGPPLRSLWPPNRTALTQVNHRRNRVMTGLRMHRRQEHATALLFPDCGWHRRPEAWREEPCRACGTSAPPASLPGRRHSELNRRLRANASKSARVLESDSAAAILYPASVLVDATSTMENPASQEMILRVSIEIDMDQRRFRSPVHYRQP